MASIPNLNTLRTGRRGRRIRRGDGSASEIEGSGSEFDEVKAESQRDRVVKDTNDDAASSRMSAVSLNYLDDRFAEVFFQPGATIPKRYPIINRGTYVRTTALDVLVRRFIRTDPRQKKQIISVGAGSDTRFFRLSGDPELCDHSEIEYHELDFEENVNEKRDAIRNTRWVSDTIQKAARKGWNYHLNAMDLRDLTKKSPPTIPNLQSDLPTLLLSECCLCYLPPDAATSVIQYFTMNLHATLALALYEPIRPFDAFGKTMVSNLGSRGIHLQTLKQYSTLDAQRQRLRLAGFTTGQGARDVHELWESEQWISGSERERVDRLEWLDEVEEWKLLASHYCVAWGWRGDFLNEAWNDLDGSWTVAEAKDKEMG